MLKRNNRVAVIAGAGPAGLTAAFELLKSSDIKPIIFELDTQVGGISKTVNYRGNRMDLGGHRFFSKSDWVMNWWQEILPVSHDEALPPSIVHLAYQNQSRNFARGSEPAVGDAVMLIRDRISRIFHRRRFFDYPLKLNPATLRNMGAVETLKLGMSYGSACINPRIPERTLEDFFINRFGARLYRTFFKDYTEKVWGVPCSEISAEWGAQRIKGLSVSKAIVHALSSRFRSSADTAQRQTETSLIERFLYPKFGPGQMWEEVALRIEAQGGVIRRRHRVVGIERDDTSITAVKVLDETDGSIATFECDYFISTMPVKDLTAMLNPEDSLLTRISAGLPYRDFVTAGLLVKKMNPVGGRSRGCSSKGMPPDNWIYIQEPDVRIGRLQIFNNWSPSLVADPNTIWLGLEYFCREGDELWTKPDGSFLDFAAGELEQIGLIDRADVLDGTIFRVPKAYPAYFGEYGRFGTLREYLERFTNLYPIGRNGMHRYNNQDHSMLSAKASVESILNDGRDRLAIWNINLDGTYHEETG